MKQTVYLVYKVSIFVLYITCFSISFSGCSNRTPTQIRSYYVECDKGIDCAVFNSEGDVSVVIEPEVDQYNIAKDYIIGHKHQRTFHLPLGMPQPPLKQPPGYFILDTKTGGVSVGLSEDDWKMRLTQLNLRDSKLYNLP